MLLLYIQISLFITIAVFIIYMSAIVCPDSLDTL
jgi:hypothetical protein